MSAGNGQVKDAITVAVEDRPGEVILHFSQPTKDLVMRPENAFPIAEGIARAAHRAKFGETPANDHSYIAEQVRARITEQRRDQCVARVRLMLRSMIENNKSLDYMAAHTVDATLSEVKA